MKKIILLLLIVGSSVCYAQDFTVSIGQLNYGKIAIIDQDIKPNAETTLNLCYLPKIGDYEYPTIVLSCPELYNVLVGKDVIGFINNMSIRFDTSEGILHYFASRDKETLNIDFTEKGNNVGITMILAKVDLETNKFQLAKGTKSWSKKIKNILTNSIVHKISIDASVTYSDVPDKVSMRSKDSKYTIDFSSDIKIGSLFSLLFQKGDALYK